MNDSKARLAGAGFVAAGALFLKICVFDVLSAARTGAPVTTHMKAVLVAPGFVILGLLLLVIGAPTGRPSALAAHFVTGHGPDSRLKPLGYVIVFAILGVGLGLYSWMNGRLADLGYG